MIDLFNNEDSSDALKAPLADRMRPQSLNEVIGQDHLLGKDAPLKNMISSVFSARLYYGDLLVLVKLRLPDYWRITARAILSN